MNKMLLVVRWPVGGIRTFMRYLYRNFDASEFKFTIIAPNVPEMHILLEDLAMHNISYVPVATNPSAGKFTWLIWRELIKSKYDIIHSHGFTSGICSAIPAFIRNIPHVMTSHDIINENQFSGWKGLIKKRFVGIFFRMIDIIQSVSYDAHLNLIKHFRFLNKRKGKTIVIQNGIEVKRFLKSNVRNLKSELKLSPDSFLIGFLGRFMAQKGFRYLVDAVKLLKVNSESTKNFYVLAFSEGGFLQEEKINIENMDLQNFFYFLPFTPNVAETIKGLDVVVIPSLWEACPLLPMEVLVCGTPLIGTDCIGLREVLHDTPAIVVPQKNSYLLAQSIADVMQNNYSEVFYEYRTVAKNRYDIKNNTLAFKSLYKDMINDKRKRI